MYSHPAHTRQAFLQRSSEKHPLRTPPPAPSSVLCGNAEAPSPVATPKRCLQPYSMLLCSAPFRFSHIWAVRQVMPEGKTEKSKVPGLNCSHGRAYVIWKVMTLRNGYFDILECWDARFYTETHRTGIQSDAGRKMREREQCFASFKQASQIAQSERLCVLVWDDPALSLPLSCFSRETSDTWSLPLIRCLIFWIPISPAQRGWCQHSWHC